MKYPAGLHPGWRAVYGETSMKLDPRLLLLMLLPMSGGCSWLHYSIENLACTPVNWFEECAFRHHIQQLACDAWERVEHDDSTDHSPAYAAGFRAGFVDFIESNGTGEPPAAPPKRLQQAGYRTPNAQLDIADWFAGFRHGSRVARETGIRDRFVIPISLPPRPVVGEPPPREAVIAPSDAFPPAPTPTPKEAPAKPAEPAKMPSKTSAPVPAPGSPAPEATVLRSGEIPLLPAPSNLRDER
jgi:hypothetical protein